MLLLGRQFKCEVATTVFLYLLEIVCSLGISIFLQEMIIQISEPENINKAMAYMYVVICGMLWMIQTISHHNAYHESSIIINRMRG